MQLALVLFLLPSELMVVALSAFPPTTVASMGSRQLMAGFQLLQRVDWRQL